MKLSADIARSLLMARWKQSLVAAIGVTFSITMFIALLSFMTGLNKLLDGVILNRTPHVRLYNELLPNPVQPISFLPANKNYYHFISSVKTTNTREEIYNSAAIIRTIAKDKRVDGIALKINTPVFFNEGNVRIAGTVNGIDVQAENRLFHFDDYITSGNGQDLGLIPNSIILGKPLAEKLVANIGDQVFITTTQGDIFPLKLVGYFATGIRDFDKVLGFTSIATAQKLINKPSSYITDIQVKLLDVTAAPSVAKEYSQLFGTHAEDIQTANAQFETGSFIRTLISYTVGITLLIVAGFGIYNILNMMIYEKMDAIAILKATGFSSADVKTIFLMIALSIGIFGGLIGLIGGLMLSMLIDSIPFHALALPGVTTYPVNYDPAFYGIGILFSLITTFLARWLPARKAGKIDPVVIIRGK